jgi:hypothetical protein
VSVELISAMFTGLTGLLSGLAVLLATRSRRVSEDSRHIRRGYRVLQDKYLAAMGHLFKLETRLAEHGFPVPARPEILESDDDDDGPTPQPALSGRTS